MKETKREKKAKILLISPISTSIVVVADPVINMKTFSISCPLDPDERDTSILRKIDSCVQGYPGVAFRDPMSGMAEALPELVIQRNTVGVEPWLLPAPPMDMLFMLTVENFVTFIDSNGCLEYANKVRDLVKNSLPRVPVTVGVDHSISGGAIEAMAKVYGGENLRLVVFDSHFDYIPPEIRCGLIQYDLETNPRTKFRRDDPYIFNRPNSYNADSFLSFIRKAIPPENTFLVGVSDYPPKVALESKDDRVMRYVEYYKSILDEGVHLIKKEEVKTDTAKSLLSKSDKPHTYVSVDVDVCANAGLRGARFLDYHGLTASDFYGLVEALRYSLNKSKLIGLDFMEFDVLTAGSIVSGRKDRTYGIMAEAYKRLTESQI